MNRMISILAMLILLYTNIHAEKPLSQPQENVRTSTDILAVALPAATFTTLVALEDWDGIKQGIYTVATTVGVSYILKLTTHKRRPDESDNQSFPSLHTATMFANATFLQRRFGWKIGIPAYVLGCYTGWGRTFGRKHDWWDVCAGAAIGAGAAYIFTRPFAKKQDLRIAPFSTPNQTGIYISMNI